MRGDSWLGLPLTNHKTMSKSLKWEAGLNRFIANCKAVMERLGVDNDVNFLRKVDSLLRELEETNLVKQEWLEITKTSDVGAAKKRTRALMRTRFESPREGVSKVYELDTSFLEQKGECWDNTGGGDTPEKIIRNWEKKIHDQRELVCDAYFFCLRKIEELAIEKGYTEEQICLEVTTWHDAMREDFHTLTAPEFWQTYRGDFVGVSVLPTPVDEQLPLIEALVFVEEVTPEKLYRDVRDCRKVIGKVSKRTYLKWEARATEARSSVFKEGREKLQTLMVEIVGLAVHRVYIESDAIPTAEERSALFSILAPEAINPYASEFCVKDDTPMSTIAGHYQQLIGAGK